MLLLRRKESFCAAHRLYNPGWSQEKNFEIFGVCANENFHGHNYELEVTITGNIEKETGFFMNLNELSEIIKFYIIKKLDHKNLNLDVDFLNGIIPTSENLAMAIWNEIFPHLKNAKLYSIKISETNNNTVEYFGNFKELMS